MSTWLRSRRRRWTEFAFEAGLTLSGVAVVATPLLQLSKPNLMSF